MNKKLLTIEQVQNWESGGVRIEVLKTSKTIKENMCLGEDVGTNMAYRR